MATHVYFVAQGLPFETGCSHRPKLFRRSFIQSCHAPLTDVGKKSSVAKHALAMLQVVAAWWMYILGKCCMTPSYRCWKTFCQMSSGKPSL